MMGYILMILYAYRWWIAAWIISMTVIGIIENRGKRKAPDATGIAVKAHV